jgi:hypothetical protein
MAWDGQVKQQREVQYLMVMRQFMRQGDEQVSSETFVGSSMGNQHQFIIWQASTFTD